MGIKFSKQPELTKPDLIVGWPGIGNVGITAISTLCQGVEAEEFAQIEPWDFFYPKRVIIEDSELKAMEFPSNIFYFHKGGDRDLIFFIGEEQPTEGDSAYAKGEQAYRMANLVLDLGQQYGCRRVYTSGAAVAVIHHTTAPRVWAAPNTEKLIPEVRGYPSTLLMGDATGQSSHGIITGLNGVLLGVAKMRGLAGICLMGEVPIYLQGSPLPYPKAAQAVVEILAPQLGIEVDLSRLTSLAAKVEHRIDAWYDKIPPEAKERLDQLKYTTPIGPQPAGPITEEDQKRIIADIDEFFKRGGQD